MKAWAVFTTAWSGGTLVLVLAEAAATDLVLTGSGVAALIVAAVKLLSDHRLVNRTIEDRDRTIADLRAELAQAKAEGTSLAKDFANLQHELRRVFEHIKEEP